MLNDARVLVKGVGAFSIIAEADFYIIADNRASSHPRKRPQQQTVAGHVRGQPREMTV